MGLSKTFFTTQRQQKYRSQLPVFLLRMEPMKDRYLFTCSEWNTWMIATCSPVLNGLHEWLLPVLLFRMEHMNDRYLFCSEWNTWMIAIFSIPNGKHDWSLPILLFRMNTWTIATYPPIPNGTHEWSLPVLLFRMEHVNDRYLLSCSEWNTWMIATCSPVPNGAHVWSLPVLVFRMEHINVRYLFPCSESKTWSLSDPLFRIEQMNDRYLIPCSEWNKWMIATCSPVPNGTHEWSLPPMMESPRGPPARDKHTSSIIFVFVTLCTLTYRDILNLNFFIWSRRNK